jgi:aspartate/methionine/tyrosine aminotransferase
MVITDEVYQNNVYSDELQFESVRSILNTMPNKIKDNLELVSANSISKGLLGECGLRGSYMELHNFDEFALSELYKLRSVEICANSIG